MGFAAHYVRQNALHFAKPKALSEIKMGRGSAFGTDYLASGEDINKEIFRFWNLENERAS